MMVMTRVSSVDFRINLSSETWQWKSLIFKLGHWSTAVGYDLQ